MKSYALIKGYLKEFSVEDSLLEDIYNEAQLFSKEFWLTIELIFQDGNRIDDNYNEAMFLHQFAFAVKRAIKKLYRKGDSIFEEKDYEEYIDCISDIKPNQITSDI
mmetsp:Transcript_35424/g.26383  ORF Transcript_35424/g.26383 Transcript_35424/m.26383 type:complete len:106 (+) Transcript_35424:577-894(+)